MSGIQNTPNPATAAPPIRVVPQTAAPVPGAAPAAAPAQDQMAASAAAAELARLRVQINSPSAIDSTMALYGLQALAATHRAQVIPILIQQLQSGGTNQFAALDLLGKLQAHEAAPQLEALARNGSDPGIRLAASSAYTAATGQPLPGSAPPVPTGPAPGMPPGAPVTPGAPAATPQGPAAPMPANAAGLIARMLSKDTAGAAAVEISRLPGPEAAAILQRLVTDFPLPGETLALIATIAGKRIREPVFAPTLQAIVRKDPTQAPRAIGQAALYLLSTNSPSFIPDVLRGLVAPSSDLVPTKRAIIDRLAQWPQALAHPAAAPVLAAVLNEGEGPNADLAAAASHALSKIRSAVARDALANSPLFVHARPEIKLRAIWDLGQHPPPYPPSAIAHLQRLAGESNKQVADAARQLLSRK